MIIGLLKWFSEEKGFGVAENPDEGEFFLHINNFNPKPISFPVGMSLIFEKKFDASKNRYFAANCRPVSNADDWKYILEYLGKKDAVLIENSKRGVAEYSKEYYKSFSLMEISASQLFHAKSTSEISTIIIDFFNTELRIIDFNKYYGFIEKTLLKESAPDRGETLLKTISTYFIDHNLCERIRNELIEQSNNLDTINNDLNLEIFYQLKNLIPNILREESKETLSNDIFKIILTKCSDEYKPELWLKGIYNEIPFGLIVKLFLNDKSDDMKKRIILSRLQIEQQLELLKSYRKDEGWEKTFYLLERIIKVENALPNNFKLSEKLYDNAFWIGIKYYDLLRLFSEYAEDNTSEEDKYELFFLGFRNDVPRNIIKQNIKLIRKDQYEKILSISEIDKIFVKELFFAKISEANIFDLDWIYELGKKFLNSDDFDVIDKRIFDSIEPVVYFEYWRKGKARIILMDQIEKLLNDRYLCYDEVDYWINNNTISKEVITNVMLNFLIKQIPVTNQIIFYQHFNHIKYLLKIDFMMFEKIKRIRSPFYDMLLWFIGVEIPFNFSVLKSFFIYFLPEEQVIIIRKLFYLKATNEFELKIDDLIELTCQPLDDNKDSNPPTAIDLSTEVIIRALWAYNKDHKYLVSSDLLSIVLHNLNDDKSRRFKFESYFEKCRGRMVANYNWNTNGVIERINYGNNKFYFAISFLPGETVHLKTQRGPKTWFVSNSNFKMLKEEVKKLPECKWNADKKHWGVLLRYEKEVLAFAKEQKFLLKFEGSKYANNTHLVKFEREEIPTGIIFCEGRLANKPHQDFKKEFWWCAGKPAMKNVKLYTILKIGKIIPSLIFANY
jgi:hypothetical protein